MVWFLDYIEDYLWDFVDWLWKLYDSASDLWLIGDLAGKITYGLYFTMWYVAYYFGDFNDWCDWVEDFSDWVSDWIDWLSNSVGSLWDEIEDFLTWSEISTKITSTWGSVTDSASSLVTWFASAAESKWGSLTNSSTSLVNWFASAATSKWSILLKSWTNVTDAIDDAIDALEDWTKQTFSDAVDDFISGFQDKFAASEEKAVAFLTALGIGAGDVITTILDTSKDMFQWIITGFAETWKTLKTEEPVLIANFKAVWETEWNILEHAWSDVTTAISDAIAGLSDIVDHTWSEVTGAIDAAISGLSDIVDHTWSEVTGAIDAAIEGLSDIVDHTWKEVTEAISGAEEAVKEWFGEQGDTVRSMVHSGFNTLDNWMDAQRSKVKEWIHAGYDTLDSWMDDQGSKVKEWIHAGFGTIDDWMDAQKDKVYGWINDKWVDKILDLVDAKVEHYKDKIWEIVEKVVEKL